MAGPTCPVERNPPDPACADKPVATNVTIVRAGDPTKVVVVTQSDAQGMFKVSLPPGNYVVQSGPYGVPLPRCRSALTRSRMVASCAVSPPAT